MPARLQEHYAKTVSEALTKEFSYKKAFEVPKLDKIVINMGVGEAVNDRKAVDGERLEPVEDVGPPDVAHLRAARVEDVGVPVRVVSSAGVRVLVQRLSIKPCKGKGVLGEMGWHPVQQDADTVLVQGVHQVTEVVR